MLRVISASGLSILAGAASLLWLVIQYLGWGVYCDKWGSAAELILASDWYCGHKASTVMWAMGSVWVLSLLHLLVYPFWRRRAAPYMAAVDHLVFVILAYSLMVFDKWANVFDEDVSPLVYFTCLLGPSFFIAIAAHYLLKKAHWI